MYVVTIVLRRRARVTCRKALVHVTSMGRQLPTLGMLHCDKANRWMLTRILPLVDHGVPLDQLLLPPAFLTRSILFKWQKQIKILNYALETAVPSASSLRFHWMILCQNQVGPISKVTIAVSPKNMTAYLRPPTFILQIGDDGGERRRPSHK